MASQKSQTYGFYELAPRLSDNRWQDEIHQIGNKIVDSFQGPGRFFFLLALILSQAYILNVFSPLAPAFYLAVRRQAPSYVWSTGAGLLLGAAYNQQWNYVLAWLLLSALAIGWQSEISRLNNWRAHLIAAVPVGLLHLVSLAVAQLVWELSAYSLVVAGLNAILATGSTLLLWDSPKAIHRPDKLEPPIAHGWGLLLLAAGVMIGLSSMAIGQYSLGITWLHFFVLSCAWILGPSWGLTSTAALSSIAALSGIVSLEWTSSIIFASLMAGLFRGWGKPIVILVYVAGLVLLSFPFGFTFGQSEWIPLAAGLVLFAFMPAKWLIQILQATGSWLRQNDLSQAGQEGKMAEFALAGGYQLTSRLQQFAEVFRQISFSFQQTAATVTTNDQQDMALMMEQVSQLACHKCPAFRVCWEQEFFQTYQAVAEQFARVENNKPLRLKGFRPNRRVLCHRPGEVGRAVYYLYQISLIEKNWQSKLADTRQMVVSQLEGIAHIFEDMASREAEGFGLIRSGENAERPLLDYQWGAAKLARHGSIISGDSHSVRESRGQLMMLLSDGMGAGTRAAMESSATLSLFEKMIDLNFPIEPAVRLVNTVLLLRSPDEVFATLDLLVVDLCKGDAQMLKIGAAATFIKRGSKVRIIRSQSLPLGILSSVDVESVEEQLEPGDMVIMISDGLLEVRKDLQQPETWIQQFLADCSESDPQELAEHLLQEASAFVPTTQHDDMTVLVARFTRNHYF